MGQSRSGSIRRGWLPSSRYRHPGDVIRLIAGGLVLVVSLAAVALAPSQLIGSDASAVTWLGC